MLTAVFQKRSEREEGLEKNMNQALGPGPHSLWAQVCRLDTESMHKIRVNSSIYIKTSKFLHQGHVRFKILPDRVSSLFRGLNRDARMGCN